MSDIFSIFLHLASQLVLPSGMQYHGILTTVIPVFSTERVLSWPGKSDPSRTDVHQIHPVHPLDSECIISIPVTKQINGVITWPRDPIKLHFAFLMVVALGKLTHWDRDKMADISQTIFFKRIYFKENIWISVKISLKFIPKDPNNKIPAFFQIMAWCRPGDKPLSEAMLASLLTHIGVTRPQWVNQMKFDGVLILLVVCS